jgi:competence protein ComEA
MTRTKLIAGALTALLFGALVALSTPAEAKRRARRTRIAGKVNINTAPAKQLTLLPRIGKSTAKRIVDYRGKQRFTAIRDIMRVKGIGKATFLKAKPYLSVHGPNTLHKLRLKRGKHKVRRGKHKVRRAKRIRRTKRTKRIRGTKRTKRNRRYRRSSKSKRQRCRS